MNREACRFRHSAFVPKSRRNAPSFGRARREAQNDVALTLHHRSQHLLLALTRDVARKFLDLVEGAIISVRVVARRVEVCPRGVRRNRP
jgi:hypothetical protein